MTIIFFTPNGEVALNIVCISLNAKDTSPPTIHTSDPTSLGSAHKFMGLEDMLHAVPIHYARRVSDNSKVANVLLASYSGVRGEEGTHCLRMRLIKL